ncbi:ATP-binding protein [Streptomyces sp. N2-109]|uniref:ATP-binding protein n=1 Tax=Streptomyces gossypii TaxID=2883101 RepID=A0ABT2K3M1_9ACTN|nr:ATP-binding protein [Streptomyces gossypii]MCT2594453.1 ATP-binding protein [Streptomyces gossypii]
MNPSAARPHSDQTATTAPPAADTAPGGPARVVLLTGPSGSGKSRLAARSGLPVLRMDDFYKEGGDPTLPVLPGGATDWDAPGSWDAEAAVAAVRTLCAYGRASVPVYDIGTSARTGEVELALGGAPLFVAEGVFAADIAARCAELGLLADTICLRGRRPFTTFRRRLLRDVRERRKPVPFLVRRGWGLMRAEGAIVARHRALGAHPCARDEAMGRITRLHSRT